MRVTLVQAHLWNNLTSIPQEALKHVESQLETAKEEAQRPFPQEDELKEKQARLDQLNIELNIDSPGTGFLDDTPGEGVLNERTVDQPER